MVKHLLMSVAAAAVALGAYAQDATVINTYDALYEFYNENNEEWETPDASGTRTIEQYSDGTYKIINPFESGTAKDVLTFVKTDDNITFKGLKSNSGVKYLYYNNPSYSYVWDSECDGGEYSSYTQLEGYEIVMFYISGSYDTGYFYLYWQEGGAPSFAEVVGNEDNTTGWWQDWSASQNLQGNGSIHFDFVNYSNCLTNWNNWVLILTNSGLTPLDGDAYASAQELAAFRADRYGWGTLYNGDALTSDWEDWDAWRVDQDGAHVELDIVRDGQNVSFHAVTTAVNGAVYNYTGAIAGVSSDLLGAFLTVEGGHLLINSASTTLGIQSIANDAVNAPVEYYNINGVRLDGDNLPAGLYIKRQGNKVTKVIRQ